MNCGEAIIQLLEGYGVDTVFGIPGVHTLELYRGLSNSSIRHVLAKVRARAPIAVVPWGFGKWWFQRGKIISELIDDEDQRFRRVSRALSQQLGQVLPKRIRLTDLLRVGADPIGHHLGDGRLTAGDPALDENGQWKIALSAHWQRSLCLGEVAQSGRID